MLNTLPRARLYIPFHTLLGALIRLPFDTLGRGQATERLEHTLAEHCGVTHVRMVSSCRMAFYFTLKALELEPGSEVLLTPLTIPDMVNAIHTLGLTPVFVDLAEDTHNIDLEDLRRKITPRSRIVLVTHLSGLVPDMNAIAAEASTHGLSLIEDLSQNWGAEDRGTKLGTFGVAAVASLCLGKTISALHGGCVLTDDERIAARVAEDSERLLRTPDKGYLLAHIIQQAKVTVATHPLLFPWLTYHVIRLLCGSDPSKINALQEGPKIADGAAAKFSDNPVILRDEMPQDACIHFTDLQARIALTVLRTETRLTERRRELAAYLISQFSARARRCVPAACTVGSRRHVYWHFPFMIPNQRERFQLHLLRHRIDNGGYSLTLCSQAPAFERFAQRTPRAEFVKRSTVFLPIHSLFSRRQMDHLARVVNDYVSAHHAQDASPGAIEKPHAPAERGRRYSLRGRQVLITGAASGVGRALSREAAREGSNLVLLDKDEEGLTRVADELTREGATTRTYGCDLTSPDAIHRSVERITREVGSIDVLINCAAREASGLVEDVPLDVFRSCYDLNFYGPLILIKSLIPLMKRAGDGQIVNISSSAGRKSYPGKVSYCVTKHALNALTEGLRLELRPFHINVMMVSPGPMNTNFARSTVTFGKLDLKHERNLKRLDPAVTARRIIRGLQRRSRTVIQFGPAEVIVNASYAFPRLVDFALSKIIRIPDDPGRGEKPPAS